MNWLKKMVLVLIVMGVFTLNLCGRNQLERTDETVVIEQTAGETEEWTDPVF